MRSYWVIISSFFNSLTSDMRLSLFAHLGASLLLLSSAPPLIGCRHLSLSLSLPHCLPLPCALLGLPLRVVFSLLTSLLLGVTGLRGRVMSYLSWGFPYSPSTLRYYSSAAFTLLPSTCRIWLRIPFLLTLFRSLVYSGSFTCCASQPFL